jgi:hypothetical protein
VLLSDWSFELPETIVGNLKFQSDYYNYGQRTLGTFIEDARRPLTLLPSPPGRWPLAPRTSIAGSICAMMSLYR